MWVHLCSFSQPFVSNCRCPARAHLFFLSLALHIVQGHHEGAPSCRIWQWGRGSNRYFGMQGSMPLLLCNALQQPRSNRSFDMRSSLALLLCKASSLDPLCFGSGRQCPLYFSSQTTLLPGTTHIGLLRLLEIRVACLPRRPDATDLCQRITEQQC